MLKTEKVSFRYSPRSPMVLKGADLELAPGKIGVLLGKNGAGKTTLFKIIAGIHQPTSGRVLWRGRDISSYSKKERAQRIGYVPQEIRFGELTVFESVLAGRISSFGIRPGREDINAAEKALSDMGLSDLAHRSVNRLSGGERQKVAIARALAADPELIVFDEPTGNLDIAGERLIVSEAKRLAREKNIAVLCSLHDINLAAAFGDAFYFLKDGAVAYSGGGDVLTPEVIKDVFGTELRLVEAEGQKFFIG